MATLESLSADARLWIFGAEEALDEPTARGVRNRMAVFLSEWTAHRRELRAAFEILEDRFLIVTVDEGHTAASGCSIDALVNRLRELEEEFGVRLLNSEPVWYRSAGGNIETSPRSEFRDLAQKGRVDAETPVFDLTLQQLGDLRSGKFERPAGQSWHAQLLGDSRTTSPPGIGDGGGRRSD